MISYHISHSLALGSLVAGTRGNGWAVAGAAVLSIAASVHTRSFEREKISRREGKNKARRQTAGGARQKV